MENIIFDLDGTLWDTTKVVTKAWNSVLKQKYNIKITHSFVKSLFGLTFKEIMEKMQQKCLLFAEEDLKICQNLELDFIKKDRIPLYRNEKKVLKILSKKHNLFIISNCQNNYIETFIQKYKLQNFFKDFDCSGDNFKNKYDCLKNFIKKHNLKSFCYIGDTTNDLTICNKIKNCVFIYAKYGFQKFEYKNKINNLNELLKILS